MWALPSGDDWVAVGEEPLPVAEASTWAVMASCGAVVAFSGTVRDHSDGRVGVTRLEYEAYPEYVVPKLEAIASEVRQRWPDVGRIALLHRTGVLELSEVSVVTVVSTPHRAEAFEACRFAIDALKATAPIWKLETWAGGTDWSTCGDEIVDMADLRHRAEHLHLPEQA